jgi:hypothetical protein
MGNTITGQASGTLHVMADTDQRPRTAPGQDFMGALL